MGDIYRDAAARAARLEEIARRREEIELQQLEREEQRLLALEQARTDAGARKSAGDVVDLTEDSPSSPPPPPIKQEKPEPPIANPREGQRHHPAAISQRRFPSPAQDHHQQDVVQPSLSLNSDVPARRTRGPNKKKRKRQKKEPVNNQAKWLVTSDPNYRTIVKATNGAPDQFAELRCYLCHGNFRQDHFIGGPIGFAQHLKVCHPDQHPTTPKLSLERVIELCSQPLSKNVVDGILQKQAGAYQVPRIPVTKAPNNSRIHNAIAARERRPSYHSDEDDDDGEDGEGGESGQDDGEYVISPRRTRRRLATKSENGLKF